MLVLLITFIIFFLSESNAQGLWEINKKKDGIEIYTRYESGSDFKSFKAIILLETSVSEIIKILRDADNYSQWYGFTKTSKLLEQQKYQQYNYVETIFPWPYKNRDMVYKMSIDTTNLSTTKIHLLGVANYLPEKDGIVRMRKAEGYILLSPMGKQIEVTYVFHSEPGDNIPTWLANNSIAELPFQTLSGLRAILNREQNSK